MESGITYQTYSQPVEPQHAAPPPPSGQVTTSTKVLNLSRTAGQPAQTGAVSSFPQQQQVGYQQAVGYQQGYQTQPQVFTVGSAQGQLFSQGQLPSQVYSAGSTGVHMQPQGFNVTSSQQYPMQHYQQYSSDPNQQQMITVGPSQQPAYRVVTTPGQDASGRTMIHAGGIGQTQPQAVYASQQGDKYRPQQHSQQAMYQTYPQQQQYQQQQQPPLQQQKQPPPQQQYQQQPQPQPQQYQAYAGGEGRAQPTQFEMQQQRPQQMMYAQPAQSVSQYPTPQQVPQPPQLAQIPRPPPLQQKPQQQQQQQQQFGPQSSSTMGAVIIRSATANQPAATGQPISVQQWQSASAPGHTGQGYQLQSSNKSLAPSADTSAYAVQPSPTAPQTQQVYRQAVPAQATPQVSAWQSAYQQQGQPSQAEYQQASQVYPQVKTALLQGVTHGRPPATTEVRHRHPSTDGPAKGVKIRALPMRNSMSIDGINSTGPPQFIQQPVPQLTINEGEPSSLTARVRPAGDSSLHLEWYKNGKPLSASSRFNVIFDRGYTVLDFLYTNEEDTGEYSCVATNSEGQDQSSGCRVTVIPEETVVTESQLPEESMIANLAALEDQMMQNGLSRGPRYPDELKATKPPTFLKPLAPQTGLREMAPAHFETVLEPANDPNLTVEWFKDGKAVSMGCRFNAIMDRGFAVLDILYCYPEDNGAYWCVAKNALGQSQSNVVELQ